MRYTIPLSSVQHHTAKHGRRSRKVTQERHISQQSMQSDTKQRVSRILEATIMLKMRCWSLTAFALSSCHRSPERSCSFRMWCSRVTAWRPSTLCWHTLTRSRRTLRLDMPRTRVSRSSCQAIARLILVTMIRFFSFRFSLWCHLRKTQEVFVASIQNIETLYKHSRCSRLRHIFDHLTFDTSAVVGSGNLCTLAMVVAVRLQSICWSCARMARALSKQIAKFHTATYIYFMEVGERAPHTHAYTRTNTHRHTNTHAHTHTRTLSHMSTEKGQTVQKLERERANGNLAM